MPRAPRKARGGRPRRSTGGSTSAKDAPVSRSVAAALRASRTYYAVAQRTHVVLEAGCNEVRALASLRQVDQTQQDEGESPVVCCLETICRSNCGRWNWPRVRGSSMLCSNAPLSRLRRHARIKPFRLPTCYAYFSCPSSCASLLFESSLPELLTRCSRSRFKNVN